MPTDLLSDDLAPLYRFALAYAPRDARPFWAGFFSLDERCARFVRGASEPITAQLRLAWWRDRLGEDASAWPRGEPLLELLAGWDGAHSRLVDLIDGWEAMTGALPRGTEAFGELIEGRTHAIETIAHLCAASDEPDCIARMAREWALCDVIATVRDADESKTLESLAQGCEFRAKRVSKPMRPLAVLHSLARYSRHSGLPIDCLPARAMARAVAAGFVGR